MSTSVRLRPWVLAMTVVVGLAGCASGEAKVTAGRERLEPVLDPQTKRPILLPVPIPDLSRDARQAIWPVGRAATGCARVHQSAQSCLASDTTRPRAFSPRTSRKPSTAEAPLGSGCSGICAMVPHLAFLLESRRDAT
jgi:hypothetical protein